MYFVPVTRKDCDMEFIQKLEKEYVDKGLTVYREDGILYRELKKKDLEDEFFMRDFRKAIVEKNNVK